MTAVSTLSTSLPVEPWRVDALQPRMHESITPRSIRAYAYSLRLSSVEQLTKDILRKGFTDYFYAAIEVTASIHTPNSSDYAPYAGSSIVLKVCGRKDKEEIEVIRLLLAEVEMPENDRPTFAFHGPASPVLRAVRDAPARGTARVVRRRQSADGRGRRRQGPRGAHLRRRHAG